jgi:glutamyl-tRNA synthetase
LEQGISKVESSVTFSLVESANRKIIDPDAKRYFFVQNPIKLTVENAPEKTKEINFHPDNKKLGSRTIKTIKSFFVQNSDLKKLKVGDIFRLKGLYNVKIIEKNKEVIAEYSGEKLIQESLKIQWTTDKFLRIKVLVPHALFVNDTYNKDSLEKVDGFAEEAVSGLKTDEIIQFERFGFVRIENIDNKITGFFTHK